MNILPKKSWHVRNKDNIQRVRKDEENARIEEEKRLKRIALAEQEARTDLLRKKAKQRQISNRNVEAICNETSSDTQLISKQIQPVILFEKESGESHTGKNKEHEKEKKAEQEEYEKKLGILTYLGQGAVETQTEDEKPWYFKAPSRHSDSKINEVDLKRKSSLDPINKIPKKKKKHKSSKTTKKSSYQDNSIEALREKRLKREKREKEKADALLRGSSSKPVEENDIDKYSAQPKYNSQYNPEFVRRKKYSRHNQY